MLQRCSNEAELRLFSGVQCSLKSRQSQTQDSRVEIAVKQGARDTHTHTQIVVLCIPNLH